MDTSFSKNLGPRQGEMFEIPSWYLPSKLQQTGAESNTQIYIERAAARSISCVGYKSPAEFSSKEFRELFGKGAEVSHPKVLESSQESCKE
jgi:hypothetical protein